MTAATAVVDDVVVELLLLSKIMIAGSKLTGFLLYGGMKIWSISFWFLNSIYRHTNDKIKLLTFEEIQIEIQERTEVSDGHKKRVDL